MNNTVLPRINENIKGNTDLIYFFTGKRKEDHDMIVEIKKSLSEIMLNKKSKWTRFISRYNELMEKPEDKLIKVISTSKKYWRNLKRELIEELQNDEDKINIINNFGFENDRPLNKDTRKQLIEMLFIDYEPIDNILSEIFDYQSFSEGNQWCRNKLITLLNIEVCPYCNRQYITNYIKDGKSRTTADLDHFYPQSKYPFLALSLYNFIPCCAICNRTFKNANDKELLYPYEEGFDDNELQIKFYTSSEKEDNKFQYLLGENLDFEIKLKNSIELNEDSKKMFIDKLERADNTKECFNLEIVYNSHKNYVRELYEKFQMYNEVYIEDIVKSLGDKLKINKNKATKLYFGNYLDKRNYNKQPLSKLTTDILEQLKMVKDT